jgi:hypothetical protein
MSARAMAIPVSLLLTQGEDAGQELLRSDAAQVEALAAPAVEMSADSLVESARIVEDLRRRRDAPYPFPWPHGGLNE